MSRKAPSLSRLSCFGRLAFLGDSLESIGLCPDHFDGTIDNIARILPLFLPLGYHGRNGLAAGAASVRPKITVSGTGKVTGLVGIQEPPNHLIFWSPWLPFFMNSSSCITLLIPKRDRY
jgi:hypothetical protein